MTSISSSVPRPGVTVGKGVDVDVLEAVGSDGELETEDTGVEERPDETSDGDGAAVGLAGSALEDALKDALESALEGASDVEAGGTVVPV